MKNLRQNLQKQQSFRKKSQIKNVPVPNDTETLELDAVPLCLTGTFLKSNIPVPLNSITGRGRPCLLNVQHGTPRGTSAGVFINHFQPVMVLSIKKRRQPTFLIYAFFHNYKFLLLYYNLCKMCTFITC